MGKVAIINYGAGNVRSVQFVLNRLGVDAVVTADADVISQADRVIFPGVGHARPAMEQLQAAGLDKLLPSLKQPLLGICLGMQLMCGHNEEGELDGLGIFDAPVVRFSNQVRVPQMGWNQLQAAKGFAASQQGEYVYFVHSYYVPPCQETVAVAQYGVEFSAVLQKDNFMACQFHPEKSGPVGERLLNTFLTWN